MAIVATLSWGAPSPDCRIHEGPGSTTGGLASQNIEGNALLPAKNRLGVVQLRVRRAFFASPNQEQERGPDAVDARAAALPGIGLASRAP